MAKSTNAAGPAAGAPAMAVVAGEELFLREQHLAELRHAVFGGEDPGMGYVRLDPAGLGAEAMAVILDEVRTPSMFAPRKLVVVDPADPLFKRDEAGPDDEDEEEDMRRKPREMLEDYLESPVEGATLVLVATKWLKTTRLHKQLDKRGWVKWAEPIKEGQAAGWAVRRAKEAYGKGMEPAAAARLAELIGPDMQRLDNELAKLSLYEPEAAAIGIKAVDALVGFQHEQQIWDMINALSGRDAAGALKKIDELWSMDPKIEYSATGAVFSWVSQVLKARELVERRLPDAAITRELRLWPPERAQKVVSLAREWGLEGAARWSEAMLRMDMANKSSVGEPRRNLEKFVVELCEKAD